MMRLPPTSTLFPYTPLFRSPSGWGDETAGVKEPMLTVAWSDEAHSTATDRKSTRLNSSHRWISYGVFCLEKDHQTVVRTIIANPVITGPTTACSGSTVTLGLTSAYTNYIWSTNAVFSNNTATTEIYTLSLHAALPI